MIEDIIKNIFSKNNIGYCITVIGWIVAFGSMAILNRKTMKANEIFQKKLLELENSNYHLKEIVDSSSSLTNSIHKFYIECHKFLLLLYASRHDEKKMELYPEVYQKIPILYQNIFFNILQMDTRIKMSESKIGNYDDYIVIEKEIQDVFSIRNTTESDDQSCWLKYQLELDKLIRCETDYSSAFNKLNTQLTNCESDDKKDSLIKQFQRINETHKRNRIKYSQTISSNLEELCKKSRELIVKIQKFTINSNKNYIILLDPNKSFHRTRSTRR